MDSKSIEDEVIQIQSRSLSDSPLSEIESKNKMVWVWTTLETDRFWIGHGCGDFILHNSKKYPCYITFCTSSFYYDSRLVS